MGLGNSIASTALNLGVDPRQQNWVEFWQQMAKVAVWMQVIELPPSNCNQ